MDRIAVEPKLLRWARERAGLTIDHVASSKRFKKYAEWEGGAAQPTMRQLDNLANAFHVPLGYLFLSEPPIEKLDLPDFRTFPTTNKGKPSPDLIDTMHQMERRQEWMRSERVAQGESPLGFVGRFSLRASPIRVAQDMRKVLGLTSDWARSLTSKQDAKSVLRDAIEEAGILIFINSLVGNNTRRSLDPEEFRGFVLNDDFAPLIFVNGADYQGAQLFTMGHELAHVWLGQSALFNMPNLDPGLEAVEKLCDAISAEFLVPEEDFRQIWQAVENTEAPFRELAKRFKVSPIVCARRALDLGKVTRKAFFQFYEGYLEEVAKALALQKAKSKNKNGGPSVYDLLPQRSGKSFSHAVVAAARAGRLRYTDAYDLIGVRKGSTFDEYASRIGA